MSNPPSALEFLIGLPAVPTVVLEHELPDGSRHFDWMIATDVSALRPLRTFRIADRLDELKVGSQTHAVQIADHRPLYLDYEGAVSGDRGLVKRVCAGELVARLPWNIEIAWKASGSPFLVQELQMLHEKKGNWRVICVANSSANR